jgi:hypothetical protein
VPRHIYGCYRPEIHDLIEVWIEVGIVQPLIHASFNLSSRQLPECGAEDDSVFLEYGVLNGQGRLSGYFVDTIDCIRGCSAFPRAASKYSVALVAC